LARHPDEVPTGFAEDRTLLERYSSEVKSRTGKPKNMAIYVDVSLKDRTTLKAWCFVRLEYRSRSNAGTYLDSDCGRFVGI